jgi:hypothetical protein
MIGEYTYSEFTDMHIMFALPTEVHYRHNVCIRMLFLAAEFQTEKHFLASTCVLEKEEHLHLRQQTEVTKGQSEHQCGRNAYWTTFQKSLELAHGESQPQNVCPRRLCGASSMSNCSILISFRGYTLCAHWTTLLEDSFANGSYSNVHEIWTPFPRVLH